MIRDVRRAMCLTAVLLGITAAVVLAGCSSSPAADSVQPVKVSTSKVKDQNLRKSVVALQADPAVFDGYKVVLVGATLDKSTGDVFKDGQVVGSGLTKLPVDEATSLGFDLGFSNSSDKETRKKDAYVSLYVKYQLPPGTGQRDSVIASAEFSGVDDRGDAVDLIHVSNKGKYIDSAYPYGVVVFKTYYDSHSVRLDLNGIPYVIDLDGLKTQ